VDRLARARLATWRPGRAGRWVAVAAGGLVIAQLAVLVSGFPPDLARYYRRCPQMLLAGVPAAVFRPVAGVRARPVSLWLPAGRGSCVMAVRALDGPAAGDETFQARQPSRSGGAA
jgi:hypothetical protein